jgi:hypothetical protein
LTSYARAFFLHYQSLAKRRAAAVSLALRLYELDHGCRPKTLDELEGEYLDKVPGDPMEPGGDRLAELLKIEDVDVVSTTRSTQ